MKLLHLQQIESAIPKLINIELPIKYAYALNLLMDDLQKHLVKLQEFRLGYLQKHGEQLDNGNFKIPEKKIHEFDKELSELLEEDLVDIKPIPIPLSMLMHTDIRFTILEIESLKKAGFLHDDINSNEE